MSKNTTTKTTHFVKVSASAMSALEAEANDRTGKQRDELQAMLDAARSRHGGKAFLVAFTTRSQAALLRSVLEAVSEYDVSGATVAHAARRAQQVTRAVAS